MKTININPPNIYSCLWCQSEFQSRIILNVIRFCSNSCRYKFAYSVVIDVFPKSSKEQKYALTKKIVEVSLT